jgi:2-polyprenyl-3-methyl-5-hydroxy-6-metoxy-1,4-benzoquinol methylase
MPDLSQRAAHIEEWMDDLEMEGPVLSRTLDQLALINRWLGGNQVMISGVKRLLQDAAIPRDQTIHLVDLGCGGGDGIRALARWAKRNRYQLQITGIDANPSCIQYAREKSAGYEGLDYQSLNCFSAEFLQKRFDIVHCGLFLHHFEEEVLVDFLPRLVNMSRLGVVINDLHRHPLAYRLFQLLTFVLGASDMVRHDGLVSIQRAFQGRELRQLIPPKAGLNVSLKWKWAFRYQMLLHRPLNSIRDSQNPNHA